MFSMMLLLPLSVEPAEIFVSKAGNDSWSGTLAEPNPGKTDGPLLTIAAAQKKVRSFLTEQKKSIKVIIRKGTYRLEKPLVFTPEDSGTQRDPVIWTSYQDEKVIISAGKLIKNWRKFDEEIPELPPKATGKIWYADVGKDTTFYSLFNDRGILPQAASDKLNTTEDINKSSLSKLNWEGNDLDHIDDVKDAVLHIVPRFFFVYLILPVKSLDKNNKILEAEGNTTFPLLTEEKPFADHCYYKIANVIEHLDEPGEWVLNTSQGRIYYWPVDGDEPGDDICYPVADELVSFRGDIENKNWVQNIELHGLIFRNTERMRIEDGHIELMAKYDVFDGKDAVIHLRGAQNITVKNCIIENSGGTGIRAGIYSANNQFSHNIIKKKGLSGVTLIGHGPGKVADNHNNIISHNEISYCGEIWGSGIGILLCGSGYNHIHNNLVHHTANHSITMLGSVDAWWDTTKRIGNPYLRFEDLHVPPEDDEWYYRRAYIQVRHNLVEYNEVHHTAHGDKMADINCLYIHGTGDGNIYRKNYLHDVDGKGIQAGIRTDGWQFFARVSENVIKNINAPGIVLKQINDYDNNILINCKERGSFVFNVIWSVERKFPLYGCNTRRNIMVQTMSLMTGTGRIAPFYEASKMYSAILNQPMTDNNIFFVTDDPTASDEALKKAQAIGLDPNSIAADPMFVDMEKGDFRFKEGSPAIKLGITPITEYGIQEPYGLQKTYKHLDE